MGKKKDTASGGLFDDTPGPYATKEIEIIQPELKSQPGVPDPLELAPPGMPPLTDDQRFELELRAADDRMKRKRGHSCGTCEHGKPWITEKSAKNPGLGGHDTGFVRCELHAASGKSFAKAQYFPRVLYCQFYPSSWLARKVVESKS